MTIIPGLIAEHDHGCRRVFPVPKHWLVEATFGGPNSCYRYTLEHIWALQKPLILWAMMNPSGADVKVLDSTVRLTADISAHWGYGGQIIVNACAYRGVTPSMLRDIEDPVGHSNPDAWRRSARQADRIMVAHGHLPTGMQCHAEAMCDALAEYRSLYVLGTSKDGTPYHPLARGKIRFTTKNATATVWRIKG